MGQWIHGHQIMSEISGSKNVEMERSFDFVENKSENDLIRVHQYFKELLHAVFLIRYQNISPSDETLLIFSEQSPDKFPFQKNVLGKKARLTPYFIAN